MTGPRNWTAVALICICALAYEVSASVESAASRKLLQTMGGCPVDFVNMDYSSVTSKCTAPYPESTCCQAYNEFCAPYKSQLNDLSNMCAINMIAYLNQAGNYGTGVFVGRCNSGSNVCN
ncbi:protein MpLRE1 [Marchantia polymorpha subsp. ruderalis]|uniref:GPI-anchored protein LLG1-like domain-containing protein n=2 Tax=Marchantia polymorpha TaxID=3197 RepID=A0A176VLU9_MARPO|nr:hypothetical protein AXG93_242s1190 [Marchantia polymorpha subsp. ruderalis]PTQ39008.1 hypothetical protein MARPO_0048s0110 [Marchantia polymorpha]BBN11164.1 hypothetical protein Mp_5g09600 [Marchantia polymorpha subsp. ruderalis]|eukprot:PTQ39008.1 hypothetical protein MARPO_0048s0110 [Marchantia polymorpha]